MESIATPKTCDASMLLGSLVAYEHHNSQFVTPFHFNILIQCSVCYYSKIIYKNNRE